MIIHFTKVRWQNFLSTGNQFTEILLDKSKSTLIVGRNGVGKSTLLDALMFALYGKPYRKINKPQLMNTITKKGLLVELEFRIGKKKYMIRRGVNPDIFEIYENGKLRPQDAKARDYQKEFIKNILKLTDKAFKQVVVLGSANYTPFMQLETYARREIIEDLLDIQIFSVMNLMLAEDRSHVKGDISNVDTDIRILESKIEMSKSHLQKLQQKNDDLIKARSNKINQLQADIEMLQGTGQVLMEDVNRLRESISDADKTASRHQKIMDMEKRLEDRQKKIRKDIEFFENHSECPTCQQGIEEHFKHDHLSSRREKLNEVIEALQQILVEYEKTAARIAEIGEVNTEIARLNQEIFSNNNSITHFNNNIKDLQNEIESLQEQGEKIENDQSDLNNHLKELRSKTKVKENLVKHQNLLEIANVMLKDSGIKTKIIKQYVPIMNQLINKYLQSMDFFINFELNESFSESIKSRHRDEFSYASFSEGEKARIDLALLFTWRAVSKLRNSTGTNLLIMDEVFDGSLDASGSDELLKIIEMITPDTNIFVISHKDQLYDKFHSVIEFEKVKNFSQIRKQNAS
jgi:DNA repair exonuclease SbcCD ATPase subunit